MLDGVPHVVSLEAPERVAPVSGTSSESRRTSDADEVPAESKDKFPFPGATVSSLVIHRISEDVIDAMPRHGMSRCKLSWYRLVDADSVRDEEEADASSCLKMSSNCD